MSDSTAKVPSAQQSLLYGFLNSQATLYRKAARDLKFAQVATQWLITKTDQIDEEESLYGWLITNNRAEVILYHFFSEFERAGDVFPSLCLLIECLDRLNMTDCNTMIMSCEVSLRHALHLFRVVSATDDLCRLLSAYVDCARQCVEYNEDISDHLLECEKELLAELLLSPAIQEFTKLADDHKAAEKTCN